MISPVRNGHQKYPWADIALCIGGILGAVLYFWLYPVQHPDGAARYTLDATEATRRATEFLEGQGYPADTLASRATLRRQRTLLGRLQSDLGRPRTVGLLKTDAVRTTPAHFWRVAFERQASDGSANFLEGLRSGPFAVDLTLDGEVWSFSNDEGIIPRHGVHREALVQSGVLEASDDRPDSAIARSLGFGFLGFSEQEAVEFARFHLRQMPWSALSLQVDSVGFPSFEPASPASVFFVPAKGTTSYLKRVEVQVTPGGSMVASIADFGEPTTDEQDPMSFRVSVTNDDQLAGNVATFALVLLGLILVVTFFRRATFRAIDYRIALMDGILAGVLAAVSFFLLTFPEITRVEGNVALLIAGGIALLIGIVTMLFTLAISGATDSMARASWPEKLSALTLARQGAFVNQPMGAALLRGTALAFVILGVTMLFMAVFPNAIIDFQDSRFPVDSRASVVAQAVAGNFVSSLLISLMVLLGAGVFVFRKAPRLAVFLVAMTLILSAVLIAPPEIAPSKYAWLLSGTAGLIIAAAFRKYDFLTCFLAIFLAGLVWTTSSGWAIPGSPELDDTLAAYLFMLTLVVLGFIGRWSGKTGDELPQYIPEYVKEMGRQQRIERELEIARQVQQSFLPREMPRVTGVDIDAICIPAQEVGGDYFDFMSIGKDRLAVIIGDVSGKGIQAAFYMTLAKGFVQTLCCEIVEPVAVLTRFNELFCRSARPGTFISMIYGILDTRSGTFSFARAGHSPVLYSTAQDGARLIRPGGIAIGLTSTETFANSIEPETIRLSEGDALILYTDGFPEAENDLKEQFGETRMRDLVENTDNLSSSDILKRFSHNVTSFVGGAAQHDDMTMVVLKAGDRYLPSDAIDKVLEETHDQRTGDPESEYSGRR